MYHSEYIYLYMYSNIFYVSVSRYLSIKIYLCIYKYLCTVRPHVLIIIIDIFLYLYLYLSLDLSTAELMIKVIHIAGAMLSTEDQLKYIPFSLSLSLSIYIYIYIHTYIHTYICSLLSSRHTVLHVMCTGTVLILAVAVQCISHGRPHVDLTMTIPPPC